MGVGRIRTNELSDYTAEIVTDDFVDLACILDV